MTVPYVNVGDPITHEQLDALAIAANAKLSALHGGVPAVLWGGGFTRKFFFFDAVRSAPFLNVAQAYIWHCSDVFGETNGWFRRYDHTPFSTFAAAATLASVDAGDPRPVANSEYPCARVNEPAERGTWTAAVWPMSVPVGEARQLLLGSLEAHKANLTVDVATTGEFTVPALSGSVEAWVNCGVLIAVADALTLDGGSYTVTAREGNKLTLTYHGGAASGTCAAATAVMRGGSQVTETADYYLYVETDEVAEHPELWTPIDVVFGEGIGTVFNWPANWNKYAFIRFNNLNGADMVVNFGPNAGLPIAVPAMSSTCARRIPGTSATWGISSLCYHFSHQPGDPLFLSRDNGMCQVMNPLAAVQLLLGLGPDSLQVDGAKFWSMEDAYCGTGGGIFGPISGGVSGATPLGDITYHRGKLLVVDVDSENDLIAQTQTYTLGALNDTRDLWMESGAATEGVTAVTVKRGGVSIASAGNWEVVPLLVGYWIRFLAGGVLAMGDAVVVDFQCHKREPDFWIIDYTGIGNLASNLAPRGITVTVPSPSNPDGIRLSAAKTFDLIGLGTDLFLKTFWTIGVTIVPGTPVEMPLIWADRFPWGAGSPRVSPHWTEALTRTVTWVDLATSETETLDFSTTVLWGGGPVLGSVTGVGLFNTIGDVRTALEGAGGIATYAASFRMTAAGPMVVLSQSMGVAYPSTALPLNFDMDEDGNAVMVSTQFFPYISMCSFFIGAPWLPVTLGRNSHGWWRLILDDWVDVGYSTAPRFHLHSLFPRMQQRWVSNRFFDRDPGREPFTTATLPAKAEVEPLVKDWFEGPFKDYEHMRDLVMGQGGVRVDTSVRLLREFRPLPDSLTDISAFVNQEKLTFVDGAGVPTEKDFGAGKADRAGFYDSVRPQIAAGPFEATLDYGRRASPHVEEHYNLAASAVNAVVGDFEAQALTVAQSMVVPDLGWHIGRGIMGYRPRTEFCAWQSDESDATQIEAFWTAHGVTIRTSADFPDDFAAAMSNNVLWLTADGVTEDNPYGPEPMPLWNTSYLFGGYGPEITDNYRWVTIADAKAVFDSLHIPFVLKGLVTPLRLKVVTASRTPVAVDGSAVWGYMMLRIANWINDSTGGWVRDADDQLDGDTGLPVIRADISRIDYAIMKPLDGSALGILLDFGGGIEQRLTEDHGIRVTQGLLGNREYVYRRYGSPPAKMAIFGRNYADYSPRDGQFPGSGIEHVPRVAVTDLEGDAPEVVDCSGSDETVVTTAQENAVLLVWPHPRLF